SHVQRAREWCKLAQEDLDRTRQSLRDELTRLDEQIAQHRAERDYAREALDRDEKLYVKGALPKDQYLERKKSLEVAQAQLDQAQSQKRSRATLGAQVSEAELARRQKELADAQGALTLLEA